MSFIETLKVLVLGIVEGFTEWLPISSTGHLILVDKIVQFKQPEEFVNMFKVIIQLGAILAVMVIYFHRLNPFSRRKKPAQKRATIRLWMKIVVACIPAAVFGLLLDDWIDAVLMDNAYVVSAMLILYGVLFIVLILASTTLGRDGWQRLPKRAQQVLTPVLMVLSLVLSTAYLVDGSYNPFLYFRF